jgi:hypothetical protein
MRAFGLAFSKSISTGGPVTGAFFNQADKGFQLNFKGASGNYEFVDVQAGAAPAIVTTSTDAGLTDGRFLGYKNGDVTLRLYRSGSSNTEIALTYASFLTYTTTSQAAGLDNAAYANHWASFGFLSPASAIPTTGNATYNGILQGNAQAIAPGSPLQGLEGTTQFQFNFASSSLAGNFHPYVIEAGGARTDLGVGVINANLFVVGRTNPTFEGSFNGSGNFPNSSFQGMFYGPVAEEVAGQFSSQSTTFAGYLWGAFAAKKVP